MFNNELEAPWQAEVQQQNEHKARQQLELVLVVLASLLLGGLGSWVFSRWSGACLPATTKSAKPPRKSCASPPLPLNRKRA